MNSFCNRMLVIFAAFTLQIIVGCTDSSHDSNAISIIQLNKPVITKIDPDSVMTGDTLTIIGSHFGENQGVSAVTIGGKRVLVILFWSDSLIRAVVPDAAVSGDVSVTVGGRTSDAILITIVPPPVQLSFLNNVRPIFLLNNCINCHGGGVGLYVGTVAQLVQGGEHGPAIIPGNADSSLIIMKLSPNPPFGNRMPMYGPYLSDSLVQIIKTWINQGAKDN